MATRLLLPVIALLGLLAVSSTASATHVRCGDRINQTTTLDADVVCPEGWEGPGIIVAADDVTLDFAGHALRAPHTYEIPESDGVGTEQTRSNVTVKNGTVSGFSKGIDMSGSRIAVHDMLLENGVFGLSITGDDAVVQRTHAYNTGYGGIHVRGKRALVARNVARGQEGCIWVRGDRPVVLWNVVSECWGPGLNVTEYSTGAVVSRNRVTRTWDGIGVAGNGALIERNVSSRNFFLGFWINDPRAIARRNIANDNYDEGFDGIRGTGIESKAPGTTLSRNMANRNGNIGIDAGPGTIDGGGNRATGNGIVDCVNVRCK